MEDPHGKPMTTIDTRRALWYLSRNLAVSLGPRNSYADVIRLTFTPKKNSSSRCARQTVETRCVVCGSVEDLTLHHVIPISIKRHFPAELKEHTREWCVLVCQEHHKEAERVAQPIYASSLQSAMQGIQTPIEKRHRELWAVYAVSFRQRAEWKRLLSESPELEPLMAKSMSEILQANEILREEILSLKLRETKKHLAARKAAASEWGRAFIAERGGIDRLKETFRDAFLGLNPKYLPEGFLQDAKEED